MILRLVLAAAMLALASCSSGPPSLPQPEGPLISWNTGMWIGGSASSAAPAAAPIQPVAPTPIAPLADNGAL